jgi:hypothetical protein
MAEQAGKLIDEWSANIIGYALDKGKVEALVSKGLVRRGVPNFTYSHGKVMTVGGSVLAGGSRNCLWLQQKLQDGGLASVALRIEKISREDTAVSWALFAQNRMQAAKHMIATGAAAYGTVALIGAGLLTIATGGAAAWLLPGAAAAAGLSRWRGKSKDKPTTTDPELREALSFGRIVEDALLKALASLHVPNRAVQVIVSSHPANPLPESRSQSVRKSPRSKRPLESSPKRAVRAKSGKKGGAKS